MILATLILALAAAEPLDSVVRETGLPPPRHGGVYIVAHRGAHEGIPENTLAAYRKAIELGCDFVEVDVRTTKDGRLVSLHNSSVDAYTSDAKGRVRDFTLAELQALDIGSRVGPEWRDERIPAIDDVFALCRGKISVYLDMKDAAVADTLALVHQYGLERNAVWYTTTAGQREVQALCPECLPMPDPGPEKNLEPMFARFDRKPRIVASVMKFCSKTFVEAAHAHGAIVMTDDQSPDDWPSMLAWGMDGIQTDHPEALISHLDERASAR